MIEEDYEADFTEVEIGRFADAEEDLACLRHEQFLEREHAERERLDREFAEELDELWKTIEADGKDAPTNDPPGWPGF
jgi:hypothetical protein